MNIFSRLLLLASLVAMPGVSLQASVPYSAETSAQAMNLTGRWQVKFAMAGVEKNLILASRNNGVASFLFLDTGVDNKAIANTEPGAWSQLTNNRVSFTVETELPIGTCCREIGTLIFKGKFISNNSISGKMIFITSIEEEENPLQFRSLVGTFTASRILK